MTKARVVGTSIHVANAESFIFADTIALLFLFVQLLYV